MVGDCQERCTRLSCIIVSRVNHLCAHILLIVVKLRLIVVDWKRVKILIMFLLGEIDIVRHALGKIVGKPLSMMPAVEVNYVPAIVSILLHGLRGCVDLCHQMPDGGEYRLDRCGATSEDVVIGLFDRVSLEHGDAIRRVAYLILPLHILIE
jgi:hypothetical protein